MGIAKREGKSKSLFLNTSFGKILRLSRTERKTSRARIFQEVCHASRWFMNLRIALAFCKIHASYIDFGLSHASRIIPLSPAKAYYKVAVDRAEFVT